jgi:hypothetical protein
MKSKKVLFCRLSESLHGTYGTYRWLLIHHETNDSMIEKHRIPDWSKALEMRLRIPCKFQLECHSLIQFERQGLKSHNNPIL